MAHRHLGWLGSISECQEPPKPYPHRGCPSSRNLELVVFSVLVPLTIPSNLKEATVWLPMWGRVP